VKLAREIRATQQMEKLMRTIAILTMSSLLCTNLLADEPLVVKEGTELRLKFTHSISTRTSHQGDPVELILVDDLRVGDHLVAKAGTRAVGQISHAKRAGMMGRGAELNVTLDYVFTDHGRVRLRGTRGREGDDKTGTAVALTVLFGPLGLIKKGKEVEIKEGTELKAFISEDFTVPAKKAS
jgi:hypothetical protein